VLCCVLKLCIVISTLRWVVLTVLWIGFCHTGPISLCVDLFVFICVYFVCSCFILHSCCIIVSVAGWDWSLILRTYLPSVLWHCWLGHLTRKNGPLYDPICVWWDVKACSIYLSYSSLDWVLSQWACFAVHRFFFCLFVCFCFILHSCIIVSTLGWTWWSLI